ncbi:hypothetical protein NDU88_004670 [Pleurodeles waltl]|uniref:Uncharacterized protein n=1 Tax=Pleurodeles waltl TaxID=8319 RepID=A0AAV7M6Z5_PLEWA|nr:hypothetical protein NDU88_004670 [Pleurodeles waltl]
MSEHNTGNEGVTTNPEPTNFLPADICSGRDRLIGGSRPGNFENHSGEVLAAPILQTVTLFCTGGRYPCVFFFLARELVNGSSFHDCARGAQEAARGAMSFFQRTRSTRSCTRSHSDAPPLPGKGRHVRVGFARRQQLLSVRGATRLLFLDA